MVAKKVIEWNEDIFLSRDSISYFVSGCEIPATDQLPWGEEECDALVLIFDQEMLTDELASRISTRLVDLPTDWIETLGTRSEYLHDVLDSTSVVVGRQASIGDGSPMTAWHDEISDSSAMIDYVRLGGLGSCSNKLVVIIGCEDAPSIFAKQLREA